MRRRIAFAAQGALMAVLVCGCSAPPPELHEAKGRVLINDKPLPRAKVRFCPENGSAYAEGVTDDNGNFSLTCSNGEPGAVSGENLVVVMEGDIPPELTRTSARKELQAYLKGLVNRPIPAKYSNAAETPLTVSVGAATTFHSLVLKR